MSRLIQSLPSWKELFPFLTWFPLPGRALRADVIAGVTAGLLAIPQSMAYAQLAGLPAYLGLYAAFLPVFIGAMWGSSSHLVTGEVKPEKSCSGAPGISAESAAK